MVMYKSDKIYQTVINIVMIAVTLIMILPMALLFICSITDENTLINNGYSFLPEKLGLMAYQYIWQNAATIFRAYGLSVVVTLVGLTVSLLLTILVAYPLSQKKLPGRNIINFYIFFTMLFSGGLVPSYIMWTNTFGIKNTLFAYLFPNMLLSAFNIILIRTYFMTAIPEALYEAAQIDGAGYGRILHQIVIPLSKPILVTVGLFITLRFWNDWTNGLYYINKSEMYTIQVLLNRMIQDIQALSSSASTTGQLAVNIPTVSIRMAIAFVAILPILMVYPFLQKYYASGIALGAVKG